MPTGNLDEPVSATPAQTTPPRTFRWPSDYYTAPVSEVRPIFPRWVPVGCGTAAAVLLVILFIAGAVATKGPVLAQIFDMTIGVALGEVRGAYAPNVTADEKARFEAEVKQMREGLRTERVPIQNAQAFLKAMQSAILDKKVTPDELDRLTKAAHDATVKSKTTPIATPRPVEKSEN